MDISARQQQIMIALLQRTASLPELMQLPEFSNPTERTLQRDIASLIEHGLIDRHGEARAISYAVTAKGRFNLVLPNAILEERFNTENRAVVPYDFERLDSLASTPLFSRDELTKLRALNDIFTKKLETAPADIIRRDRERITIELSWKSSQIEGNTYTLLETESLLKEGTPAEQRSQEETIMIINHKKALDFTSEHSDIFRGNLTAQIVIDLHKILAEGLIGYGIRERLVGITGSAYKPLDNRFQLEDELKRLCTVMNAKEDVFEKALLAFTYICYLQPFNDGNKRTARILANAILYGRDAFPLSLRAVSVNTYKLAILAFYELGILGNVKSIFIDQAQFASENYAI